MMLGPRGNSTPAEKQVSLVDVVKQAAAGGTKTIAGKDTAEDIMVMDTKLKIIEILQVSFFYHLGLYSSLGIIFAN